MADEEKGINIRADQINELARGIFRKKEAGENWGATFEFEQLYNLLDKWSKNNASNQEDDIRISALHDAIDGSLKSYDGVRDFLPFYKVIFEHKVMDIIRKTKKCNQDISLDNEKINNNLQNKIDDKKPDVATIIEMQEMRKNAVLLSATLCIEKMNKNKYIPLFFTDRLVYVILNSEAWFDDIVQRNHNKFDEVVVNEFMNSLLTGECDSVTKINEFECRPLSDFTGKQRDIDKPCCDKEPNYHVFNCFLKEYDRGISQSAFSQQKEKYFNMLKSIKEKIGYFS